MKKVFYILFIFILSNSVFGKDKLSIIPIKTDYNEIQTFDDKNQQTVISDSGIEIIVDAEVVDENLQYNLVLKNIKNKNFKVKQDCIKTYYGNFDKNEWTENDSTTYKLPKVSDSSTGSNKNDDEKLLEYCIITGATCVCALTLIELCNSNSSSKKYSSKPSSTRKVEPRQSRPSVNYNRRSSETNFIWLFIDTPSRGPSVDIDINTDITINNPDSSYNSSINDVYKGSFLVPLENSPDYKLRFIVSEDEYIDFYFSRSDRDSLINPLTDKPYGRHSVVFNFNKNFDEFGGSYIYSGTSIGFYLGGDFNWNYLGDDLGYFCNDNLNDCFVNENVPYPEGLGFSDLYKYQLKPNGNILVNKYNFDIGLTIKLFSNTWLMAGCGVDISQIFYDGSLYWKYNYESDSAFDNSSRYLTSGYVSKNEIDYEFKPEIGINIIIDHIDLGCLVKYSINQKDFSLKFMAGIAF